MIDSILFFVHYILLLNFGLLLSFAFTGIKFTRKVFFSILPLFLFSTLLQFLIYNRYGEAIIWKLYPVIAHFPIVIVLCIFFRKKIVTTIAAITSAYLYCQPAKWFGLLFLSLTQNATIGLLVRITTLIALGLILLWKSTPIAQIYNKDNRSVLILSSIPIFYYLYDYTINIYTDFWITHNRIASEFLPFFLGMAFLLFCLIYYKEYEQKTDAERHEQLLRIKTEQIAVEIDAIKKSELSIKLLRHDMRLLLNNLALSIEQDNKEYALKMISGYISEIDATALHRYCENDTINYILTTLHSKCQDLGINLYTDIVIAELSVNEIMFSSILSNILDNAVNAQKELPAGQRSIRIMLKATDGKILLSVKNPFKEKPLFINDLPVSSIRGHGYGTQSICYLTERLGGNYQFILEDNTFVVRIII